jgi:hypothetical protein
MYVEMWQGATIVFRRAAPRTEANFWGLIATLLFTAFSFEAYLNHIGPKLFKAWMRLEKLPVLAKLEVICERVGVSFNSGTGPLQSIQELFQFRNLLAHGRNETIATNKLRNFDGVQVPFERELPKAKWEKMITHANVRRIRDDVEKAILKLNAAADPNGDPPFSPSVTSITTTLEDIRQRPAREA